MSSVNSSHQRRTLIRMLGMVKSLDLLSPQVREGSFHSPHVFYMEDTFKTDNDFLF